MHRAVKIGAVLLALAATATVSYLSEDRGGPPQPSEAPHEHDECAPRQWPATMGPAQAAVAIEAYYEAATGDFDKSAELLARIAEDYAPHVRVSLRDTSTPGGKIQRGAAGLEEDGLTVSGRHEFSRAVAGKLRKVRFLEAPYPYGSQWREADLREFVRSELARRQLVDERFADQNEEAGARTITFGAPDSPVQVTAYYPMPEDCVDKTCEVLNEVAEAYKDRVYFQFVDTCSDDGFVDWCDAKTICHGIVINGKQEWKVRLGDKEKEVTFFGPIDTRWTRAELEAAIEAELVTAGGSRQTGGTQQSRR